LGGGITSVVVVTGMVTVAWLSVTGLSGACCRGASEVTVGVGVTTAGGVATLGGATTAGAGAARLGGAATLDGVTTCALPPACGAACDVVVVVVIAWVVVVVVVVVDVGGVVVVAVPLDGGCSGTGELDVGELVVADDVEVEVSDDEVAVSDDGEVGLPVCDDVLVELDVEVSDPGATTAGSGIGGGGAPGGSDALASLASTLTVSCCH
jgi:hypothetical protein